MVYYNEFDKYAAQWLRNLIDDGQIAKGIVDERDIRDVTPNDLRGHKQCHFFAGIGGWSLALRLAGWPDDMPIWTGSCPCQPFSTAGKRSGFDDERHLWPAFHWLITQCRPEIVVGEQVAGKYGLAWLDLVWSDMEACDYTFWAASLNACSVGAPHIRNRLYWMGYASGQRGSQSKSRTSKNQKTFCRSVGPSSLIRPVIRSGNHKPKGFWKSGRFEVCSDGKQRLFEPSIRSLVDGLPESMDGNGTICWNGTVKGAGNAIVPQVAAAFISSIME